MSMAEKRLARTSYARDRSYLDNHVLPRWGKVRLGRITRMDVGGLVAFEDPTTERAFRTVPTADLALDHLHSHLDTRVDTDDARALLSTSPGGGILRPTNWRSRLFNPAVKPAKLEPPPHNLRHTAASLFISAGANPWMLAEVLGHTDTRMIDRVYGHLFDKDREQLRHV